jgi:predicted amidohydrolase
MRPYANLEDVMQQAEFFIDAVSGYRSDFAFHTEGIKAEATPNTEMILIADVDIDLLRELNQFGSVRNLKDRRKDIFEVILK